jgi:hypothetical protein
MARSYGCVANSLFAWNFPPLANTKRNSKRKRNKKHANPFRNSSERDHIFSHPISPVRLFDASLPRSHLMKRPVNIRVHVGSSGAMVLSIGPRIFLSFFYEIEVELLADGADCFAMRL